MDGLTSFESEFYHSLSLMRILLSSSNAQVVSVLTDYFAKRFVAVLNTGPWYQGMITLNYMYIGICTSHSQKQSFWLPFIERLATNGNRKSCLYRILIRVRRLLRAFLIAAYPMWCVISWYKILYFKEPKLWSFQGGAFWGAFFVIVCHTVLSVPSSLVVTCWERADLLAL